MPLSARLTRAMCAIFACLGALPARAAGDGWVVGGNSRARLNWCGTNTPAPADPRAGLLAFVELQLDPGWKTYWRMPGDAGVAPAFEVDTPNNVAKATVYYPAPHRMPDQGGEAVGYKTSVIFPVRIDPRDAKAPVPLVISAAYGICKNICVPVELKLTGECHGLSPANGQAVEAVPRTPGEARPNDPKLVAVTGSVAGPSPRLTVDVDFGAGATETDLFVEAPDGLFVPLPARASPDAAGRARFVIDLQKTIDAKDLLGKSLRLTMVGSKGAAEAVWVAK
jgi:DsbC/DsbD-like thiol-disulfide interchange protein